MTRCQGRDGGDRNDGDRQARIDRLTGEVERRLAAWRAEHKTLATGN